MVTAGVMLYFLTSESYKSVLSFLQETKPDT